jgi:hypothetical protein
VDPEGCWIWRGYVINSGYGTWGRHLAHRRMYEERRGEIPAGLVIDHLCRKKLCVNPDHLEAVPQRINVRRGRKLRLTDEDVRRIRKLVANGRSRASVGREYDVDPKYIGQLAAGLRRPDS